MSGDDNDDDGGVCNVNDAYANDGSFVCGTDNDDDDCGGDANNDAENDEDGGCICGED